jgi:hypothetical protein
VNRVSRGKERQLCCAPGAATFIGGCRGTSGPVDLVDKCCEVAVSLEKAAVGIITLMSVGRDPRATAGGATGSCFITVHGVTCEDVKENSSKPE